ncbi:MAG: lipoyl synthase [Candidatus Aminicenantes bacterium]|nr:lipoyl synthase [Candidatus Aminicenantes bacterium]
MRRSPKPDWLRIKIPAGEDLFKLKKDLTSRGLHTICQDAKCPNMSECWNKNHATFLTLGNICSRNCGFCSVETGQCEEPDKHEPEKISEMVKIMGLKYVVITSVTRDDLSDGGSAHYKKILDKLKREFPDLKVEVLIPDFKGDQKAIETVLQGNPDVLNHNIETVRELYKSVNRKEENYKISLSVLKYSSSRKFITKSGIMVGMGETTGQLRELFSVLLENGVDILTIGQYLQPTPENIKVKEYITPEKFLELKEMAETMGFRAVESGPFVRSSYNASALYSKVSGGS